MPENEKVRFRKTTAGELVAEMFEANAKAMPPSKKEEAKILRAQAKSARELLTKVVIVRVQYKNDDF